MTRTRLHLIRFLVLVAFLASPALPASGQFWEEKDWRQWTKKECERVLTDSPWAKTFTTSDVDLTPTGMRSGGRPEREVRPTIEYVAQLRSALPIRQAVVRMMQFQSNYDRMSDAEKRNFDQQAASYINQDFSNRVVVHITYQANVQATQQGLNDTWRKAGTDLPAETYLIGPRGDRIELARFIPPSGAAPEFELIFAKILNGEPIASKADRKLQVQLPMVNKNHPGAQSQLPTQVVGATQSSSALPETGFHETRVLFEFDVQKMLYRGKLEY